MKKLLLTTLALVLASVSFAYNVGDYIYTTSAKFKVISQNMVSPLSAWSGTDDADTWSAYNEEDATANCLQSLDGSEGTALLFTSTRLTWGSKYIVTFKIKGVNETTSSVTPAAQNEINAFITNGAASETGVRAGAAKTDYTQVAAGKTILNGEWTEISFDFTDVDSIIPAANAEAGEETPQDHYLNVVFGRLTTGTVIADVEVFEVTEVYDTRIMDRKIDYINKLKADENFSGGDATELDEVIETYQGMVEAGEADVPETMADLESMLDEAAKAFLDQTSSDLSSYFTNIGITGVAKYNRGNISNGQQINNFMFRGSNWLHSSGAANLSKQIQGSYANDAGSVALYNTNLPSASKYYIAGEVRNCLVDKNYNATYTLEKNVKIFIGSDTLDLGTIKGEDWQKFYYVADLKEGETFEAGFWWEGHTAGSGFYVRNFEVRTINAEGGETVEEKLHRKELFTAFKTQWDAATSQRNALLAKQGDTENFPWEQDSIANALQNWDGYYQAVVNAGWLDAEGEDTRVATNDELEEWAKYTGVELYGEDGVTRLEYQLVRNFQWANSFVAAQNKPYTDLKAKVAEAEEALANPNFASCDPDDLNAVLATAKELVAGLTSENQFDDYTQMLADLSQVLDVFYESGASFAEPAEVSIVDGDFTAKTGNIAGGTTTYWNDATNHTGWVSNTTDSKAYFRVGSGGTNADGEYIYDGINRAAMWRGYTGNPRGSLYQEVTVTKAGHYEFTCQAYCISDDSRGMTYRTVNVNTQTDVVYNEETEEWEEQVVEIGRDTIYYTGIYLVFGPAEAAAQDSIEIYTGVKDGATTIGDYTPWRYSISYDKATDGDEILKFGLDAMNAGLNHDTGEYCTYAPNAYGFGSVKILYGGPSDKYYEDKAAAEGKANELDDIKALIRQYVQGGTITINKITEAISTYLK